MRLVMDLVVNHTSDEHPWFVESRSSQGQPQARLVLVAPPAGMAGDRSRADELALVLLRLRLGARRGDRRVLPAPVLAQAARPQLGEPRGPRGRLLDDALVAGPRGRRLPHGRHQHDLQGPRAARRRDAGDGMAPATAASTTSAGRASTSSSQEMHREVFAGPRRAADRRRDARRHGRGGAAVHRSRARRGRHGLPVRARQLDQRRDASGTSHPLRPARPQGVASAAGRTGSPSVGWNSLYWNNHDQPRVVSRFGDDGEHRVRSAKLLGTVLHLHRGTPYVYQGEELGMTNAPFDRDRGLPRHRVAQPLRRGGRARATTRRRCSPALRAMSRDNARTPMQWDALAARRLHHRHAVDRRSTRTTPRSTPRPRVADPDSVFHHYRRLIELRHAEPAVAHGDFTMLLAGRRARVRVHPPPRRRRAARASRTSRASRRAPRASRTRSAGPARSC